MIPKIQITEKGIITPSTEQVKAGVWDMLKQAFGTDLNTSESTPQGQLVVSLTASIQEERNKMIYLLNQFDPRYAEGIWQGALGEIYFMTRKDATRSIATVEFVGLRNTVIPSGFLLADSAGRQWRTTSQTVIAANGRVLATIECVDIGAIDAAPNTITTIVQALSGADRVSNPSAAISGRDIESRADFEERRSESVTANAQLVDASVRGAIAELGGVVDVFVASNNTAAQITVGKTNYALPKNSIVISVVGGNNQEIAWQALVKAGTGVTMVGNTQVTAVDNDTYPQQPPSYQVNFLRPATVTLNWKIAVQDRGKISYQEEVALKQAIVDSLKSGKTRGRIGQSVRTTMYVASLYSVVPELELVDLTCGIGTGQQSNVIELGIDQFPNSTIANVEIVNA